MRAIVTGATGFVGSWLTLELIKNAYDVLVIVRDSGRLVPEIQESESVRIIEKDIHSISAIDFSTETKFDVCYHLAWSGVEPEEKDNMLIQLGNIESAIHLMDVCAQVGCKHFVSTGTVAEYALSDEIIDVDAKPTPNDIYAAAKVATRYLLEVRARQLNMSLNWIILSSVFGERRLNKNIITYTIENLLNGKKPMYGHLEQMWDFLYVGEAVRAIRLIGERGKTGKTYGIGSGEYRSLKEYVQIIRDVINPQLQLGIGENENMSTKTVSSCVDICELVKDTGFHPELSFEEAISSTIKWFEMQIHE